MYLLLIIVNEGFFWHETEILLQIFLNRNSNKCISYLMLLKMGCLC